MDESGNCRARMEVGLGDERGAGGAIQRYLLVAFTDSVFDPQGHRLRDDAMSVIIGSPLLSTSCDVLSSHHRHSVDRNYFGPSLH